jgi:hypothetical protein
VGVLVLVNSGNLKVPNILGFSDSKVANQVIDYINSMNVDDEFSNYNAYSKLFDFIEKIFEEETNF